ncbi:MAG TPA: hypothetical protein VGL39_28070 [Jatrophihabitantaceae bacterium]|jgi:hypothetical protein
MIELVLDFKRYAEIEPTLSYAESMPGPTPPELGSRVRVRASVHFTVPLVARFVGQPTGTITVTEWIPAKRIVCNLESRHFTGWISVSGERESTVLSVTGELVARNRVLRAAVRPWTPLLKAKAARSIERVINDAAEAIQKSRQ